MLNRLFGCKYCRERRFDSLFTSDGETGLMQCRACGQLWSRMFNYTTKEFEDLRGNYIVDLNATVYVLSDEESFGIIKEFLVICGWQGNKIARLTIRNIQELSKPGSVLYIGKNFNECEDVLGTSLIIKILNRKVSA